ncbi:MAG: IS200/IS605 family transposase [Candidatus Diapherotrites archaeon CG09_land_8_20_14_0_10_32_12]|nr:MAG: IS200/IS605 family transposase [Candidatus Diapherotrites archaeon CG09_land_8_20_14_0_10_32_12]
MVEQFVIKKPDIEKGNSTIYNINYHIVFCPKYRKKILNKFKEDLELIFKAVCEGSDWKILELKIMEDHIHLFVSSHPQSSPMEMVKKLKGISARLIFKKYPELKKELWGKHLWGGGYYVGTTGVVTKEAIQKYIIANSSNL